MIDRIQGKFEGRNKTVGYKDLVFTVATASDDSLDFEAQTRQTFETLDLNLEELNSSKKQILSAQVYISSMSNKNKMDEIWCEWIGKSQKDWPQRACLGVALEGNIQIEITLTAIRNI
jgi:enamine deaminase RidA (YjgF/YER057c/UK114 family)